MQEISRKLDSLLEQTGKEETTRKVIDNTAKDYIRSMLSRTGFLGKYEQVIDAANTCYQRHLLSLQLLSVFFDERDFAGSSYDKERDDYNHLDSFRMGIIEEISFFFFDEEDLVSRQKLWTGIMQKLKNKVRGMRRKIRLKST